MRYSCSNSRRLRAVKQAGVTNGIEYLEVRDTDEPTQSLRQRTLFVRLLLPVPAGMTDANVRIDDGEVIAPISVEWAVPATDASVTALVSDIEEPDHVLVVRTRQRGDFSRYVMRLVAGASSEAIPSGFDVLLAEVPFGFKVECPSEFDCAAKCMCGSPEHAGPTIDYLAKDYQGFRRVMLERMSLLAPEWTERNPADVGVALVEMLAYVADELSYRQDAVATEAYLDTARSRISLRRHARLVDYRMHDGCNARAWVQVQVGEPTVPLAKGTPLYTEVPDLAPSFAPFSPEDEKAKATRPVVFETVDDEVLHQNLNEMRFWTWGELGCCLPRGATSATLRGHHPDLRAGDVLILAENVSPTTGEKADADPGRRWPVRLVAVSSTEDPSGLLFPGGIKAVTDMRWSEEDATPFPLCLNVEKGELETAVAWGNIVLADQGQTLKDEDLGEVPDSRMVRVSRQPDCPDAAPGEVPTRFRPVLDRGPATRTVVRPATVLWEAELTPLVSTDLTTQDFGPGLDAQFTAHAVSLAPSTVVRGSDPRWSVADSSHVYQLRKSAPAMIEVYADAGPAAVVQQADLRSALPALTAKGTTPAGTQTWHPVPDLLASPRTARELAVETEHDGTATLRFGDGTHGVRPAEGTAFTATYRVGNGVAGNVGREAITHAVTTQSGIEAVSNPLQAFGGVEPETAEEVRRDAPQAFSVQERAVTAPDYAEVTERNGQVQRAAATFRWTGSWHTVFVTADGLGGKPVDAPFERGVRSWLERFRMAGYDLEVDAPTFVPLEIALHVCVSPGHFRPAVGEDVHEVLSDGTLPQGRRGLFHPDSLTFGQPVYLSSVLAAIHSVPGVQSVTVKKFQRQRRPETNGIEPGVLPMGRLEIARLDDDPNFPEHGVLELTFGGGT